MIISATIRNGNHKNYIVVTTDTIKKAVSIPSKTEGRGSSVNGGELLFLSIATCFCNDVYREASKRKMVIESVEVTVTGEFGKEGEAGSNIVYDVKVESPDHTPEEITKLIQYVDKVAEVHNTLRKGVPVSLRSQG